MKFGTLSLSGAAALLTAALATNALPPVLEVHYAPAVGLHELLPKSTDGWTYADKSIAETAEVKAAVNELLNFSDGAFRVYRKGDKELSVYLAYWEPGRMDPRLVGVHSPDVCWVGAGWRSVMPPTQWAVQGGGQKLGVGELRTFEAGGQRQNVVFWHFVGGRPSGYMGREVRGESFWTWSSILRSPRAPIHEQWFVRLSTGTGNLSDFEGEPIWRDLMSALAPIGL